MIYYIPGEIISVLTFPGIIIHEMAHRFFCDLAKIPVYEVCYFRIGKTAGYVIHAPIDSTIKSFFVSFGPLIINSLLCAILLPFPLISFKYGNPNHALLALFLGWIGFSIGAHAIPSKTDVYSFIEKLNKSDCYKLFLMPAYFFSLVLLLFSYLSAAWFDFFYAYGIGLFGVYFIT